MKRILVLLLAICLAGSLAGCKNLRATELTGDERDAVLAFSEPATDDIVTGLKSGDYAVFSKDFDKSMKYAMQEGAFQYFKQDRDAKLGSYVSRKVKNVARGGDGLYTVIYDTVFEREKDVIMRVVFRGEEPHQVSGLWFDR